MDSLFEVSLFNWGEPLLNPHITNYIEYFVQRGIRVVVHTNFSARDYDESFLENLIRSGLTHLIASIDGATQANYEKYRVGGNIERAHKNLALLALTRSRLRSEAPQITYKMLLNRYNQGEVDQARHIAHDLGVDFLLQEQFWVPPEAREEWIADSVRNAERKSATVDKAATSSAPVKTECFQLWNTLVVNANGDVLPCCLACTNESVVGNLVREPFEAIWNNDKMVYLRKYALDATLPPPDFPNCCAHCSFRYCTYNATPN
jgi:radical SAM protein with 4Fe4S-binding SPASM domain